MRRLHHGIEDGMFVRSNAAHATRAAGDERPAIVFLHGLGESGLSFEPILAHPELAEFRCLAPDLPGYGKSPWSDEPLSLPEQADRIADWLKRHEPAPAVIVGHSMGGVYGLLLAERHPERVAAFVNVEGNVSAGDCTASRVAAGQALEAFVSRGFAELVRRTHAAGVDDDALRGYHASMAGCDPRVFHRNGVELVEVSDAEIVPARMAALEIPVWHVPGLPGGNPPRTIELLTAAGIRVRPIEPAGHWPHVDRPDDFARLLAELLRDLPAARAATGAGTKTAESRRYRGELVFDASAEEAFAALCPVRERMGGEVVHSTSGGAEEDLVFRVPAGDGRAETIYTYAVHDPVHPGAAAKGRVKVVGFRAGDRVTIMDLRVRGGAEDGGDGGGQGDGGDGGGRGDGGNRARGRSDRRAVVDVAITRIGLSPSGDARVAAWTREAFDRELDRWRRDLARTIDGSRDADATRGE